MQTLCPFCTQHGVLLSCHSAAMVSHLTCMRSYKSFTGAMILQFYDMPHQTSLSLGGINFISKYMEQFNSYLSQYNAFPLQRPIS